MGTILTSSLERLIIAIAIIAAVSVLAAVGTITGDQCLGVISILGTLLLGGNLALASPSGTTPTPAPVVEATVDKVPGS